MQKHAEALLHILPWNEQKY